MQAEQLKREIQEEEKLLFGHSEEDVAAKEAKEAMEAEEEVKAEVAQESGLKLGGSDSAEMGPSACQASGRSKPQGKFDVVISWYTKGFQSHLHNVVNLKEQKSGVENQNEITYLLRGIDQFRMLPYVNKIFIVMDRAVVGAHGAPRNVNWKHPKIKAVYAQDLGCAAHPGPYGIHASLHKIPGISEWFLYIMDDIFLARPFSMNYLFSAGKPKFWKGQDNIMAAPANCPTRGMPRIQTGHQPWFVNKCYMQQVERENIYGFKSARNGGKFSATCVYDTWMNGHGLTSASFDPGHQFGLVCHLGIPWSQCAGNAAGPAALPALNRVLAHPPMFLNIQGSGISDDYPADAGVRARATQWFHTFFRPSALTNPAGAPHGPVLKAQKKKPEDPNSFAWVFHDP